MDGTEGLTRGQAVLDTGSPILVPAGPECLGRIMNVIGEPVDERGPIKTKKLYPIHAPPPEFVDQSTVPTMLETGIKVVDLLAPYAKYVCVYRFALTVLCALGEERLVCLVVLVSEKLC